MQSAAERADGAKHVRVILLVDGHDGQDDLHFVAHALREERAQGAVGETRTEGRFRGWAAFAPEEGARDLARGVHPLFEVDGEREEVHPGPRRSRHRGRAKDDGVAVTDPDGAAGEASDSSRFDTQGLAAELACECLYVGHGHTIRILRPLWGVRARCRPGFCDVEWDVSGRFSGVVIASSVRANGPGADAR